MEEPEFTAEKHDLCKRYLHRVHKFEKHDSLLSEAGFKRFFCTPVVPVRVRSSGLV